MSHLQPELPDTPPGRDLTRTILRNALVMTVGGFAVKALNFLFIIYVIRLLGEVGFGQFNTVVAFAGLFSVFLELGMSQYVSRTIAKDRTRTQELFWNLVALRLVLAVPGVFVIALLAALVGLDPVLVSAVFVFGGTFVLAAFLTPLLAVLAANERFEAVSACQVANQVITMVVGVLLLWWGLGFFALVLTGFVAMPVQIVISWRAIRRFRLGPLPFRLDPRGWPAFIWASIPFGVTSLALAYNFHVDTVILSLFHGDQAVGWYNASYRLVFNLVGLVGGLLSTMTPSLAREQVGNPERVRVWIVSGVQWMALFALPAAAGISILAQPITDLLFGAAFAPSGPVLALICWDLPLLLFMATAGNVTAAIGLEHPAARIFVVGAVLNILLNLLAIPFFGPMGAAAVTVLTDGVASVLFFLLLGKHLQLNEVGPRLTRTATATVLMGMVVWLARDVALPLAICAGVASYGVLVLALGAADIQALRPLAQALRARLSHSPG